MKALVVGAGSIGTRHLENLAALGVEARAVVEPEESRRRELQGRGVVCFAALADGLAWGPTLVVVATPTRLHVEQARAAARHGCHLLVEKPLSHARDGVDELCAEVRRAGLVTLVGCNMRFHPGPALVKRLLEEGAVGRPLAARLRTGSYLPAWRPDQDYRRSYSASPAEGGAILDCIHELDLALWYFGPARLVAAARLDAGSLGLETDGLAEILLRHDGGVLSSVHLNFVQRDYRRGCQVIGTEGTLYWDFTEHRVDVYDTRGQRARELAGPPGWEVNRMYRDEMAHFLDCVRAGRETVNPVPAAAATLELALAARAFPGGGAS
jgi:predicted dehydrogenase